MARATMREDMPAPLPGGSIKSSLEKTAVPYGKGLEKVVKLLTSDETSALVQRQVAILKKVCKDRSKGFLLCDLPAVTKLLPVLSDKLEKGWTQFHPALLQAIFLCALPPVLERSNEDLTEYGLYSLQSLYASVGELLSSKFSDIRLAACEALRQIALGAHSNRSTSLDLHAVLPGVGVIANDTRPAPHALQKLLLLKAGVVGKVVELLGNITQDLILLLDSQDVLEEGVVDKVENDSLSSPLDEQQGALSGSYLEEMIMRRMLHTIMKLLTELSASRKLSPVLVGLGTLELTIELLSVARGATDYLLKPSLELLWNCLEDSLEAMEHGPAAASRTGLVRKARKTNATFVLSTESALSILRSVLEALLHGGYRQQDKSLRNETIIVMSLIARNRRSHALFRTTGVLALLIRYATAVETGTVGPDCDDIADVRTFATISFEDLELRRLLWALIGDLSRDDEENLAVVCISHLVEVLLMYVNLVVVEGQTLVPELTSERRNTSLQQSGEYDAECEKESPKGDNNLTKLCVPAAILRLTTSSLKMMQQQAMWALLTFAPRLPAKLQELGGHVVIVQFLERCGSQDIHLQESCMMLLATLAGLPGLQADLGAMGAIELMLHRFNDLSLRENPYTRSDAVVILAHLCSGNEDNQRAFRVSDGVPTMIGCIAEYCRTRTAAVMQERKFLAHKDVSTEKSHEKLDTLIVHAVDCLWVSVVGNKESQGDLLACEGLDTLLDLLEVCPPKMRHQVAGCAADILQDPQAIPYARAWRSDCDMLTLAQLMMRLWIDEEKQLGVERPDGVLQNVWRPLGKHSIPETEQAVLSNSHSVDSLLGPPLKTSKLKFSRLESALAVGRKDDSGSHQQQEDERGQAAALAGLDLRGKIAVIMRQVGYDGPILQALQPAELSALYMAMCYFDYREGEAWDAIKNHLSGQGLNPIAADAAVIESKLEAAFNKAHCVKCRQMAFLQQRLDKTNAEESAFFASITHQRDQEYRQQLIKRNALLPGTMKKKKAATQAKMVARVSLLQDEDNASPFPHDDDLKDA